MLVKAVAVSPGTREISIRAHPRPTIRARSQVLVRTLEVGVCGTDREICTFAYGTPPEGSDYLILGHEALGCVVEVGDAVTSLKPGDLVVPSVRRPCPHDRCSSCRDGQQDFCDTGEFTERGIKMAHGFLTEYFVEEERYLYYVPPELREVAVLVEPLTVAEKALEQVWRIQRRLPWYTAAAGRLTRGEGKTAVVLGAGPIGMLGAMMLVAHGFRTFVYSRSLAPNLKAKLCEAFGASYIATADVGPAEFASHVGQIDLVYEAVGAADIAFEIMKSLGTNGVFIFTGIPVDKPPIPIAADMLMRNLVLKNQAVIGTVNADGLAFERAIQDLGEFMLRWPDAIRQVITARFPIGAYRDLLLGKNLGIKNVISMVPNAVE